MTAPLPRKSAKNTTHALRILATGRYLTGLIRKAEAQAKAYLMEKELKPKDRRSVTLDDGADIGTVSLAQGRKPGPKVTDPIALAAWLDSRGISHGGKPSVQFPEWFTAKANLEALLERLGGELPDGLELPEEGAPYILVRQSTDQALTLRDSLATATAQDLLAEVAPLQIEGPQP